ncbi:MAG: hypothetical protein MHPSP_000216 [Paramarteilia canceri]
MPTQNVEDGALAMGALAELQAFAAIYSRLSVLPFSLSDVESLLHRESREITKSQFKFIKFLTRPLTLMAKQKSCQFDFRFVVEYINNLEKTEYDLIHNLPKFDSFFELNYAERLQFLLSLSSIQSMVDGNFCELVRKICLPDYLRLDYYGPTVKKQIYWIVIDFRSDFRVYQEQYFPNKIHKPKILPLTLKARNKSEFLSLIESLKNEVDQYKKAIIQLQKKKKANQICSICTMDTSKGMLNCQNCEFSNHEYCIESLMGELKPNNYSINKSQSTRNITNEVQNAENYCMICNHMAVVEDFEILNSWFDERVEEAKKDDSDRINKLNRFASLFKKRRKNYCKSLDAFQDEEMKFQNDMDSNLLDDTAHRIRSARLKTLHKAVNSTKIILANILSTENIFNSDFIKKTIDCPYDSSNTKTLNSNQLVYDTDDELEEYLLLNDDEKSLNRDLIDMSDSEEEANEIKQNENKKIKMPNSSKRQDSDFEDSEYDESINTQFDSASSISEHENELLKEFTERDNLQYQSMTEIKNSPKQNNSQKHSHTIIEVTSKRKRGRPKGSLTKNTGHQKGAIGSNSIFSKSRNNYINDSSQNFRKNSTGRKQAHLSRYDDSLSPESPVSEFEQIHSKDPITDNENAFSDLDSQKFQNILNTNSDLFVTDDFIDENPASGHYLQILNSFIPSEAVGDLDKNNNFCKVDSKIPDKENQPIEKKSKLTNDKETWQHKAKIIKSQSNYVTQTDLDQEKNTNFVSTIPSFKPKTLKNSSGHTNNEKISETKSKSQILDSQTSKNSSENSNEIFSAAESNENDITSIVDSLFDTGACVLLSPPNDSDSYFNNQNNENSKDDKHQELAENLFENLPKKFNDLLQNFT